VSSTVKAPLGIKRIDSLHFFVNDLPRSRDHYVQRLDFVETAVGSPEFELAESACASLLEAGEARFVFMAPTSSLGESFGWLAGHPEGVGRLVFEVESVEDTFALLMERGATPISAIEQGEVEDSLVRWFDIATAFGDTLFRFVEREGESYGMFPGMERVASPTGASPGNRFAISGIDHVTTNFLTLRPAILWMQEVLGLERYWGIEFHTQDVTGARGTAKGGGGSGLKSVVMWDPQSGIKFANNEPAAPAFRDSQIYRFCVDHRGAGVQHVALAVGDIVSAVGDMRQLGVEFMPTPSTYYDALPGRVRALGIDKIDEPVEVLSDLEILVDGGGPNSYLLQIFMREAASLFKDPSAGPLFIELIQRKGDRGFGAGNFRALFESIEREQAGVLRAERCSQLPPAPIDSSLAAASAESAPPSCIAS
jgi:4-hydroxyphenylpyruvate dioxygenase